MGILLFILFAVGLAFVFLVALWCLAGLIRLAAAVLAPSGSHELPARAPPPL